MTRWRAGRCREHRLAALPRAARRGRRDDLVAGVLLWFQARTETEDRAVANASTSPNGVADNPTSSPSSARIDPSDALQPYAEALMRDTGVDFVTMMAPDRTRYTHRERDRDRASRSSARSNRRSRDGPSPRRTRARSGPRSAPSHPIRDDAGEVVALVAAGVTVSERLRDLRTGCRGCSRDGLLVLVIGAIGSWTLRRYLSRVTGSRGPEDMARMFDYYESVLHSVREGLVLVDRHRRLVLVNDQAAELLGLPPRRALPGGGAGRRAAHRRRAAGAPRERDARPSTRSTSRGTTCSS